MSITINDNLNVNAPKPTDARYLANLTVYPDVNAVNGSLVPSRRHVGLTVLVATAEGNVEYWYKDGTTDLDLVLKTAESSGAYEADPDTLLLRGEDGEGRLTSVVLTSAGKVSLHSPSELTFADSLSEYSTSISCGSLSTYRSTTMPDSSGTLALTSRTDGKVTQASTFDLTNTSTVTFAATNSSSFYVNNGTVNWRVYPAGPTPSLLFRNEADTTIGLRVQNDILSVRSTSAFAFTSGSSAAGTVDLTLARDAANTLALRNTSSPSSPQTFNLYGTYSSPTGFERLTVKAVSESDFIIGTEKGTGAGSARGLTVQIDGGVGGRFFPTGGFTTNYIELSGETSTYLRGLRFKDNVSGNHINFRPSSSIPSSHEIIVPALSGTLQLTPRQVFAGVGGVDSADEVVDGAAYEYAAGATASGLLYTPSSPTTGQIVNFVLDNKTGDATGPLTPQSVLVYQLSPLTLVATVPAGLRNVQLTYDGTSWSSSISRASALTSRTDGKVAQADTHGLTTASSPTFAALTVSEQISVQGISNKITISHLGLSFSNDVNTNLLDVEFPLVPAANRTITFPDASGTVALAYECRSAYTEPHLYIGRAPQGSSESASVWTIKRQLFSGTATITTTTATGVAWTDRLTATYT